jgi:hypothetical protein
VGWGSEPGSGNEDSQLNEKQMGIVKNNNVMATTSGTVGQVYFRTVRGKLIVSRLPGPGRKFSPRQLAWQKRFGEYSTKTKEFLKDPAVKEKYQARVDNQKFTAQMVAQSDMMRTPEVEKIDVSNYRGTAGDKIVVKTSGDMELTKVVVTVVAESGDVIESGGAVKHEMWPGIWHYNATIGNPGLRGSTVKVAVYDVHGNVGRKHLLIS